MIIITTIGLLTALLGYLGINYTKDLKQQLDEAKSTLETFEMEISNERDMLNREISNFHNKMSEEIKKYDKLSNRYEKSLSNLEILRTNLDQQMNIVMDTFLDNIAKSNEKLYEEISSIKKLNEKSKELINKHEKLNEDLENLKKELENKQKDFIREYGLRINKILESQIIWIRQDLAEMKGGFEIEDKNLVIKFTDITLKGKKQQIIGLRLYSLNNMPLRKCAKFRGWRKDRIYKSRNQSRLYFRIKINN